MINKKDVFKKFFEPVKKDAKVCIYGSNKIAEKLYDKLTDLRKDVEVKFFVDSKNKGEVKNLPVYLATELFDHINEVDTAIVASYSSRFYLELVLKRFGIKNVLIMTDEIFGELNKKAKLNWDVNKSAKVFKTHKDRALYKFISKGRNDRQKYSSKVSDYYNKTYPERYLGEYAPKPHYLEYINKNAIKIAIDGGGFDGFQSLLFLESFPNCEKVYTFEPSYESFKNPVLDTIIQQEPKIEIVKKGLWDKETTLEFREESQCRGGSAIVETKPGIMRPHKIITIDTMNIDKFSEEKGIKIDFIKMDIENAELKALQGAEKVLVEQRPQLAISIYHSDEHFYGIPLYLQNLLKDYEFHFGHYSGRFVESLIYAIPKELVK